LSKKKTTQENLNKIIEFRQAIYEQIIGKSRNALFEAWDALILNGALTSFPMLSQHTIFQRKWHSSVCVGYPYSLLDWVPKPNASWSLSVSVRRIGSHESAKSVGVGQIQALNEARKDSKGMLDIVAGDGKYGNAGFLGPLQGQRCGLVVRLRKDRVLSPKLRGIPPGWPKGHRRSPKQPSVAKFAETRLLMCHFQPRSLLGILQLSKYDL